MNYSLPFRETGAVVHKPRAVRLLNSYYYEKTSPTKITLQITCNNESVTNNQIIHVFEESFAGISAVTYADWISHA